MTAPLRDRLRLDNPIGVVLDRSVSSYPTPVVPNCRNVGDRPGWLLSKWHCAQDHQLDQRYGIRCGDYWRLYELQRGRCALCGYGPRRWRLVVHHNHQTGTVDALLHFPCNRVIDPLLWLLPRLVALMVDPPGRQLGLVVPAGKLVRLEAKARTKADRARTSARTNGHKEGTIGPTSNLERIKQLAGG